MAQYDRRPSAGEETIRPRKNIAGKINFHVESEQDRNDDVHATAKVPHALPIHVSPLPTGYEV